MNNILSDYLFNPLRSLYCEGYLGILHCFFKVPFYGTYQKKKEQGFVPDPVYSFQVHNSVVFRVHAN